MKMKQSLSILLITFFSFAGCTFGNDSFLKSTRIDVVQQINGRFNGQDYMIELREIDLSESSWDWRKTKPRLNINDAVKLAKGWLDTNYKNRYSFELESVSLSMIRAKDKKYIYYTSWVSKSTGLLPIEILVNLDGKVIAPVFSGKKTDKENNLPTLEF